MFSRVPSCFFKLIKSNSSLPFGRFLVLFREGSNQDNPLMAIHVITSLRAGELEMIISERFLDEAMNQFQNDFK